MLPHLSSGELVLRSVVTATLLLFPPPTAPVPITLFSFDTTNEPVWSVVNDGVMGGRSSGFVERKDGAFWLEVDFIRAVSDASRPAGADGRL